MLHCMKLNRDPFEKIKSGSKTIEMRLFDEKRQRISVGDFIEFSSADNLPKKNTDTSDCTSPLFKL